MSFSFFYTNVFFNLHTFLERNIYITFIKFTLYIFDVKMAISNVPRFF